MNEARGGKAMITREEADELMRQMAAEGNTKGAVLRTDAKYVEGKWGKEGLAKVEAELQRLGYPIEYEKARLLENVPIGLRVLSLSVIKDVFHLSDEDIKIMGNTAPKFSFLIKLVMRFFASPQLIASHAPEAWSRFYTVGRLTADFYKEGKYSLLTLSGIHLPPIMCRYLEGYFQRMHQFSTSESGNVKCEEQPSPAQSDVLFKITWD
jgi:hypothetical protein